MSTSSLSILSNGYLQSLVNSATGSYGLNAASASSASNVSQATDSNQLSPFAKLVSTLQRLEQSNPTEYKQVTGEIATNLQNAAQNEQAQGNTSAAAQLTQLAGDFKNASNTGQLPNLQDLAQAVGGSGHHHRHHAHAASADSDGDGDASSATSSAGTSSTTTTASSSGQTLSQLLAALQASGNQLIGGGSSGTSALDPLSIINSTLQNAGVNG